MNGLKKIWHRFRTPFLLAAILVFAAYFRINSFWLPHVSGDEFNYTALAMKLDKGGLNTYNLRGVDFESFSLDSLSRIVELIPAQEDKRGMLLEDLYRKGRGYYDRPLDDDAPALPYLIMASQKTIGGNYGYFLTASNLQKTVKQTKPYNAFKGQFYATLWPFIFSLLFVLLTFFLGKGVFNDFTGLCAAFLVASNPVSILNGNRIWADEPAGAFMILAIILIIKGFRSKSVFSGLLAGASAGVAFLFKQTTAFLLISIIIYHLWDNRGNLRHPRSWFKIIADKQLLAFAVAFVLVSGFWFLKVYEVYGTLVNRYIEGPEVRDEFGAIRRALPPAIFIQTLGVLYLAPLFILSMGTLLRKIRSRFSPQQRSITILLWIWIILSILLLSFVFNGKEHRYLLPAYPALAVMSSYLLYLFREWLKKHSVQWKFITADELVIVLLLIHARWAVPLGMEVVYNAGVMIVKPFGM